MAEKTVDFSRFTRTAETSEVARQQEPRQQLRSQAEIERNPTSYQRQQEQEGKSNWSGGVWGGRVDRSRGHMGELEKWNKNGNGLLTPERRLMNEALARLGTAEMKKTSPPARGQAGGGDPAGLAPRKAGRLMVALDLTGSREHSLHQARIATGAMFDAIK